MRKNEYLFVKLTSKMSQLTFEHLKEILVALNYNVSPKALERLINRVSTDPNLIDGIYLYESEDDYEDRLTNAMKENELKSKILDKLGEELVDRGYQSTISQVREDSFETYDVKLNDYLFEFERIQTKYSLGYFPDDFNCPSFGEDEFWEPAAPKPIPIIITVMDIYYGSAHLHFKLNSLNKLVLIRETWCEGWYKSGMSPGKTYELEIGEPTVENLIRVIELFLANGKAKNIENPTIDLLLTNHS